MFYRVRFLPMDRSVDVPAGTPLLEAAQRAGVPLARGCAGDGLCARCGVRIVSGSQALGTEAPRETQIKRKNRVPLDLRLACCARIAGDLEVTTPYWSGG